MGRRFFKAWEGSETWSGPDDFAGEVFGLPGVGRRRFVACTEKTGSWSWVKAARTRSTGVGSAFSEVGCPSNAKTAPSWLFNQALTAASVRTPAGVRLNNGPVEAAGFGRLLRHQSLPR